MSVSLIFARTPPHRAAPAWRDDTTRDLQYQTLYVSSPGVAASSPGRCDALSFWNRKPHGLIGECILFGFNSVHAPDLSFGPAHAGSWHYNLSIDCDNVNLAVPWSRFALSDDGATAVAWVQDSAGAVTIFCLDGQTGALRWKHEVPCGSNADECQYFLAYGADVSPDGLWVLFDEGIEGSGPHRLHVLAAADGTPRSAPVESLDSVPAHASDGALFMFTADDAATPSTGAFSTWRWDAASRNYTRVGGGVPPLNSAGHGWTLAQYAFSTDAATGVTWLGVVWVDTTLLGPSIVAIYDASAPARVVSSAHTTPLEGSDIANAGAVIDCAGAVCVAGFYTQEVGGPQPTLVVLAGTVPGSVWNVTTPGSVDAVSVARHESLPNEYWVLAAGCTSVGV